MEEDTTFHVPSHKAFTPSEYCISRVDNTTGIELKCIVLPSCDNIFVNILINKLPIEDFFIYNGDKHLSERSDSRIEQLTLSQYFSRHADCSNMKTNHCQKQLLMKTPKNIKIFLKQHPLAIAFKLR